MSEASGEERSVLVVDDSAFMRRVISDMIERFPGHRLAGAVRDGAEALRAVERLDPDLLTLDIEMPGMDGFAVLETLMATRPRPVVVLSAYTPEGSRSAMRALELGAVDIVAKPSGAISLDLATVEERLYEALRAAGAAAVGVLVEPRPLAPRIAARVRGGESDAVVAIAASTGGPRAISALVAALPARLGAAVLIVQHMPPGFTAMLAARLDDLAPWPVAEAIGGERVVANTAWVAPGGFHMRLRRAGGETRIVLDQRPSIWGTRPAADALFPTVAEVCGPRCLGVVLTGMGRDGASGLAAIRAAGGRSIAQDEATSVVYGMPAHAVASGVVERSLPLERIPEAIVEHLQQLHAVTVGEPR